ncbi:hypothetical protein TUM18999_48570 [Pseudomonas tohonis]|uniref:Uncharacterized protein n=1 Tax=Pseudomonas tohonis TaxID=2725477 RepID=A0A6J4EBL6_9PSED|nr:hypothetical protein [Pseudomonas tohonis]BCG26666.1 hypothetical protein TUM18999_48570 [Pseudomonas tohonis]GJN50598.1 hypothetical protein TUM20286_03500 [Pseudomonas tohonis]
MAQEGRQRLAHRRALEQQAGQQAASLWVEGLPDQQADLRQRRVARCQLPQPQQQALVQALLLQRRGGIATPQQHLAGQAGHLQPRSLDGTQLQQQVMQVEHRQGGDAGWAHGRQSFFLHGQ